MTTFQIVVIVYAVGFVIHGPFAGAAAQVDANLREENTSHPEPITAGKRLGYAITCLVFWPLLMFLLIGESYERWLSKDKKK